ncbi:hypothetical protein DKM19_04915 [Streptosporangium sp. 'caverna']|nr:hypothetical protein DKM19_04915 [Streptosporangium sp. 'caverna']
MISSNPGGRRVAPPAFRMISSNPGGRRVAPPAFRVVETRIPAPTGSRAPLSRESVIVAAGLTADRPSGS